MSNIKSIVHDNDIIVVFSDDIEWCKDNLHGENMRFHEAGTATDDLILMSLMQNIISGTSSTYSYVGKLLNKNIKEIPYRRLCGL